jgi:hypothetical protein
VAVDDALVLFLVGAAGVLAFAVPALMMTGSASKVFLWLFTASAIAVAAVIVYIIVIASMVGD